MTPNPRMTSSIHRLFGLLAGIVSSGRHFGIVIDRELTLSANAFQSQNEAECVDMDCTIVAALIGLVSAPSSVRDLTLYRAPRSDS